MVLYNLVDTYFIGLTGDDYRMAAVNLAYPVMMVSVAISNIIGTGASSFIARCICAASREQAERAVAYIGDNCRLVETDSSDHTIHTVHMKEYIDAVNSLLK